MFHDGFGSQFLAKSTKLIQMNCGLKSLGFCLFTPPHWIVGFWFFVLHPVALRLLLLLPPFQPYHHHTSITNTSPSPQHFHCQHNTSPQHFHHQRITTRLPPPPHHHNTSTTPTHHHNTYTDTSPQQFHHQHINVHSVWPAWHFARACRGW